MKERSEFISVGQHFEERRKVIVTYDKEASAMYVYFASTRGAANRTVPYHPMEIILDEMDQIRAFRIRVSADLSLCGKLEHALLHPEVTYDESAGMMEVSFDGRQGAVAKERVVSWDSNIDLGTDANIIGIEILFRSETVDDDLSPERAALFNEANHFYADGRLKYVETYLVDFDDLDNFGDLDHFDDLDGPDNAY